MEFIVILLNVRLIFKMQLKSMDMINLNEKFYLNIHLKQKYGPATCDYFTKSFNKNQKVKKVEFCQKLLTSVVIMVYNRCTCYFVTNFQNGIDI